MYCTATALRHEMWAQRTVHVGFTSGLGIGGPWIGAWTRLIIGGKQAGMGQRWGEGIDVLVCWFPRIGF